jgi:predicted dehydrogenase/threonine dehydrogenase-like Zn-dependent dehydrogenase
MKQVIQSVSGGPVTVVDVPAPVAGPTEVLVKTIASVISAGTEAAVTKLAQANLLQKAKARPDLVRQVVTKAQREGIRSTVRSVRNKLDSDIPLGYSACGVALEVGEAVAGIRPGDTVATGGAGKANHAHFQAVPGLLCAKVPDGVKPEDAAMATIASIAMHGVRLSGVTGGERVVVIGMGLIGQLTMRIARAFGCDVVGIDINEYPLKIAEAAGFTSLLEKGRETTETIHHWTKETGADAVIITAGTRSSSTVMRTPEICRDRATVVVVGDVGLELERTPFYEKELSLRFARSYGPGRYERSYEEWGVDYPAGHLRWTEGRNIASVLDLIARGVLDVSDLTTQSFPIEDAASAYKLIEERSEPYLGIRITYGNDDRKREILLRRPTTELKDEPRLGFIGAGSFTRSVLIPSFRAAGFTRFISVTSASGLSARKLALAEDFEKIAPTADAVIEDPGIDVVVIATPHDTHGRFTSRALSAGKHVFCEKPLALGMQELDAVRAALSEGDGHLFVGFNRRWSPHVASAKSHFAARSGPITISYLVNAGVVPEDHWYNDRRQGGRLIGEACHFVDTCAAIAESEIVEVLARASPESELLLAGTATILLRFSDGSFATISYVADAPASAPKERIEVLGRARSATITDFRRISLDGKPQRSKGDQDKGHLNQAVAFREVVTGRRPNNPSPFLASSKAILSAAQSIKDAVPQDYRSQ